MSQAMSSAESESADKREALDEEAVEAWLKARIAEATEMSADDVDIDQPFSYYGMDSIVAVGLSGELEDWLGVKLSPTLTWDFPTIRLLAKHLASLS